MLQAILCLVVVFHLLVVLVNVAALFILPFTSSILSHYGIDIPFWFTVFLITPIESSILFLTTARTPCPLTLLENNIRKKLGMKEIGGFVGYYITKRKWRKGYVRHLKEFDTELA